MHHTKEEIHQAVEIAVRCCDAETDADVSNDLESLD